MFKYSVFNAAHELLITDSVIIIVEDDTTHLPCGLYAHDDWAYATGDGLIEIPVLLNDVWCGDSADFKLEIFTPNGSTQPHHGTAYASDGRIWYTPGDNGPVQDSLFYKLSLISDPTVASFAAVHVNLNIIDTCSSQALNDHYSLDRLTQPDTIDLFVLSNDILCDSVVSLTVTENPQHGDSFVVHIAGDSFGIKYAYDSPTPATVINDSLRYEVCTLKGCKTAKVRLTIF
jgi:hypothetical protein